METTNTANQIVVMTNNQLQELMEATARRAVAGIRHEPENNSNGQDLLSYEEVGKALGVSKATLWRWAKAGRVNPIYLTAHTVRFRRSEIESLLNN